MNSIGRAVGDADACVKDVGGTDEQDITVFFSESVAQCTASSKSLNVSNLLWNHTILDAGLRTQLRIDREFQILKYLKLITAATALIGLIVQTSILAVAKDFVTNAERRELGRNGLWHVIHDLCVPSSRIGLTFPCLSVSEPKNAYSGWALLSVGSHHLLTIPTRRVIGIESPEVQNAAMPNLWNIAWEARRYLSKATKGQLEKDYVVLAINSAIARSQDQLHIHTGCVRLDVQKILQQEAPHISSDWSLLNTAIDGIRYRVRSYAGQDLSRINIFSTIPDAIRNNPKTMARQALAVVATTLPNGTHGFYLLNYQADGRHSGQAEALLDKSCKAL